jgi:small subunit ribosomal protein S4
MSRYQGPHLKIIRCFKTLPGLTSKRPKNRKDSRNRSSSRKISQYRIRPEEKQKLHFHYGLTE